MKIGVFTTSFPRTLDDEAGIFVGRLVDAFSDEGLEGVVVTPLDNDEPTLDTRSAFDVRRYKYGLFRKGALAYGSGIMPNIKKDRSLLWQVPGLLLGMSLAAIWTWRSWKVAHANWVICALPLLPICIVLRRPLVVTLRGEDSRLIFSRLFGWIFRRLLRSSSAIVCVGQDFKERLALILSFPEERIHVIGNGVAALATTAEGREELRQRFPEISEPYLLFVGRMIEVKRTELLIELLALPCFANHSLVLVGREGGEEYMSGVHARIDELGVRERVHLIGAVTPSEVFELLNAASYYVSASEREGRPNAVLEALACGLIPIVSDIEPHKEIVRDNDNGLLFDAENIAALSEKITSLENDSERKSQMQVSAKESVSAYTWEATASQYRKVFESCAR